jgi:predicted amidohydrolase
MSTLSLSIIQTDLHWEDKAANLAMLEQKISGLEEKTEIVVLPEMFSTGFSMQPELLAETMEGETVQWMKKLAGKKKIILAGSVIIQEEGHYYNRLIWMLPNGQYGVYDKRHRFAFAGEDEHYTAGTKRFITSVKGWKIQPLVCYDLRFPVWARQSSTPTPSPHPDSYREEKGAIPSPSPPTPLHFVERGETVPEYDVLIYVANWPEKRIHAWKTLLQARAIENQCYVVGVNRTGDDGAGIHYSGESMIVDPMGEVLYTKKDEEDVFTIILDKGQLNGIRERLPFLKDADGFVILNDRE